METRIITPSDGFEGALARARDLEQLGVEVAHELASSLAAVKALAQLGLRTPANGASHHLLRAIESEVARMQKIVQVYLALAGSLATAESSLEEPQEDRDGGGQHHRQ